jgi:hypothetical protein
MENTKVQETINALVANGMDEQYAIQYAEEKARIVDEMKEGVCEFEFFKKDGSLRKAKGTLKDVEDTIKGTGKSSEEEEYNPLLQKYYDIEKQSWRCFLVKNLNV